MMVFTQWDSWTVAQHIFHAICSNCDSIVACGGMLPALSEALSFAGAAKQFIIIGDNEGSGNVMTAARSAYAAAARI